MTTTPPDAVTLDEQIEHQRIYAESTAQWLAANPESANAQKECARDAAILTSLRTLKRIQSATMPEPVAWAHAEQGRVDTCHQRIKEIWDKANPQHLKHDTIPLYGPEVLAIIAGLRAERDNWRNAAEAIRLNHKAYSERAELAESRRKKVMEGLRNDNQDAIDQIALMLAKDDGVDDPQQLIWEGNPPEPWGEVWMKYQPQAERIFKAMSAALLRSVETPS